MHAVSSYRGNRPTKKHKQTNPQTGQITIHCTAKLSTQCNNAKENNAKEPSMNCVEMGCSWFTT